MATADKNLRFQQNLGTQYCETRNIALIVLQHRSGPGSNRLLRVKLGAENMAATVNAAQPGSSMEVEAPFNE